MSEGLLGPVAKAVISKETEDKAATWMFNQVVPTILLFIGVVGAAGTWIWYQAVQAPAMRAEVRQDRAEQTKLIKEMQEANNAAHEKIMRACTESNEKTAAQTAAAIDKVGAQNTANAEKLNGALERLGDRLLRQKD